MAHSLGYKLFKTDCIEDMPFEQFKVLVYANAKMAKELEETTSNAISQGVHGTQAATAKATTFRIVEES